MTAKQNKQTVTETKTEAAGNAANNLAEFTEALKCVRADALDLGLKIVAQRIDKALDVVEVEAGRQAKIAANAELTAARKAKIAEALKTKFQALKDQAAKAGVEL